MLRIGITGHSNISAESVGLIESAIRAELQSIGEADLVGITCLARGADQIFAQEILNFEGTIEVVLPASDYRARKVKPENAATFDSLISQAQAVHVMPFESSNSAAYMAASKHLLNSIERLIAVWDGQPSGGYGGTADVVAAAEDQELSVTIIWPSGATRT